MNFVAVQQTIQKILSMNTKFNIPRFQREYSWEVDHLEELWKDIMNSIEFENEKLITKDYFIGSLVMVGEQSDSEVEVVDGQQRLTSITILLSALVHYCDKIGEEKTANGTYSFIETKTKDDDKYFRLNNENSSTFIKTAIQSRKPEKLKANTKEEKALITAYNFFERKFTSRAFITDINEYTQANKNPNEQSDQIECLKAIRDQVLAFNTIYITEPNDKEAGSIFETLNAKGLDLSTVDLIKNQIFKEIRDIHPTDAAKIQWKRIKSNLREDDSEVEMRVFMRHHWISKYEHVAESKIYRSFIKNVKKEEMQDFINELEESSKVYKQIHFPKKEEWRTKDEKSIYHLLNALNLMRVVSPRPVILALMEDYSQHKISPSFFNKALKSLVDFHFSFSSICSLSPSGLEIKYSKCARELRQAKDKEKKHIIVNELIKYLNDKKPTLNEFKEQFVKKLRYSEVKEKEKKLVQYFFVRMESALLKNDELGVENMSLEHILPQSLKSAEYDSIGNLIPLHPDINSQCGHKSVQQKLILYRTSNYKTVKMLISELGEEVIWTSKHIEDRAERLAEYAYKEIFTVN